MGLKTAGLEKGQTTQWPLYLQHRKFLDGPGTAELCHLQTLTNPTLQTSAALVAFQHFWSHFLIDANGSLGAFVPTARF
jgi:hypothetical protein